MFNFENVTNTKGGGALQSEDVKVFSNNRIRFGSNARKKIGLEENKLVLVQRDKTSGKLFIAAVEEGAGMGRPVDAEGGLVHKTVSALLGGKGSVWSIGEGTPFNGVTYFEMVKENNHSDEVTDITEESVEEEVSDDLIPQEIRAKA